MKQNLIIVLLLAGIFIILKQNAAWNKQHEQMLCMLGEKTLTFSCPELKK